MTCDCDKTDHYEHVKCWVCPSPHLDRKCPTCRGRIYVVVKKVPEDAPPLAWGGDATRGTP